MGMIGAAAIGGGASIYGANKAATAQTDASNSAIAAQQLYYKNLRDDLAPFKNFGTNALTQFQEMMPYFTSQVQPLSREGLENLPGYQFTRDQGLRAAQNALTMTGLGRSGAAVKAASRFATGLADTTYNTQANYVTNLELANRSNVFNRLLAVANLGENAAAGTGTAGTATGQGIAGSLMGAGSAQGAAAIAGGNAITGAANNLNAYAFYNQLLNRNAPQTSSMYDPANPLYNANAPAYANPYAPDPANYAGYNMLASGAWFS